MNWDERYNEPGYSYGTDPNDFLVSVAETITPGGRILCLAEGEGRNAVYLASLGYDVIGVDGSEVGLRKAQALAAVRGVTITTIHADLGTFEIGTEQWDGIIACYCHVPLAIRIPLHNSAVRGLKQGGVFMLEAFSKEQLAYNTGGPQSLDMLMSLADVKRELAGLELRHAVKLEREVREGSRHTGLASVIQIVGIKPVQTA
ncbi:MAG TPA: class I SAM-dependent methyltransferase [Desulfuromonadales bacterium]|nr:class I SAM-dependent methyltransferase [Desulfuromonadales bacterium]